MKTVLDYIELKRKNFEGIAFFKDVLCNTTLTGEQRLCWAPMFVPFVMGYADLNKYVFRDESVTNDPIQKEINKHTYEEDSHYRWLLADLQTLNLNPQLSMSDCTGVLWSDEFSESRILILRIAQLAATQSETYQRFVVIEAIEAMSITFFRNCVGIKTAAGEECQFFGEKHYKAEANHDIHHDKDGFCASAMELTTEQQVIAKEIVDEVFELFGTWSDSLTKFAREQLTKRK